MKTILSILMCGIVAVCFAAPSVIINAGSIKVTNQAAVLINNNGSLQINTLNGFFSDNTTSASAGINTTLYGPEGLNDALTINPISNIGSISVVNYSGQIFPGSSTTINRWWKITLSSEQNCTLTFRVRNQDVAGFTLSNLSPFEKTTWWRKMSSSAPTISVSDNFTSLTYTNVSWLATKGVHNVTLGYYNDDTLPVELSSFTAIATPQNSVILEWITQSEHNLAGYYLFRNTSNDLNSAEKINSFIEATNTSNETTYTFIDREAVAGHTYFYWLQNVDMNGEFEFFGPVSVTLNLNDNDIPPQIPTVSSLQKIYPNPFNPFVTITYGMAKNGEVEISIYNTTGQRIKTLYKGTKAAGNYRIVWNAMDENNVHISSGLYIVKMKSEKLVDVQKIVLVK